MVQKYKGEIRKDMTRLLTMSNILSGSDMVEQSMDHKTKFNQEKVGMSGVINDSFQGCLKKS